MESKTTHVSLCRAGGEAWLLSELRQAVSPPPDAPAAPAGAPPNGPGWVAWQPQRPTGGPAPGALAFERQRLPDARFLPRASLEHWTAALLQAGACGSPRRPGPLGLHCFAANPEAPRSLSGRAARLERRLLAGAAEGAAALLSAERSPRDGKDGSILQVCLVEEGLWWAVTPSSALVDPHPGGVHRMARAAQAPSRSYLKIVEALEVLGRTPQPRERVIDLGAAPGGWSYAFLQRGCRVLAVDNGPLKVPGLDALPGELTHLHSDGLRLRPPPGWVPADWMLSDMLIPPGMCLGLLRKWIEGGWMRHFVVNVKLPQREPLAALQPLRDYLSGVPGLAWRMRQLYHDRREVTVMGSLTARPAARTTAEAARQGAAGRAGRAPRRRSPSTRRRAPTGSH